MTLSNSDISPKARVDRWLWASRFFKTRQDAVAALRRGNISVNGYRAKPAKMIVLNDQIIIRKNQLDYDVRVLTLAEKRVSAKIAQTYYAESEQSQNQRLHRRAQLLENREKLIGEKPNKKDRRTRAFLKRKAQL